MRGLGVRGSGFGFRGLGFRGLVGNEGMYIIAIMFHSSLLTTSKSKTEKLWILEFTGSLEDSTTLVAKSGVVFAMPLCTQSRISISLRALASFKQPRNIAIPESSFTKGPKHLSQQASTHALKANAYASMDST